MWGGGALAEIETHREGEMCSFPVCHFQTENCPQSSREWSKNHSITIMINNNSTQGKSKLPPSLVILIKTRVASPSRPHTCFEQKSGTSS